MTPSYASNTIELSCFSCGWVSNNSYLLLTVMVAVCCAAIIRHAQCLETFLMYLTSEESKFSLEITQSRYSKVKLYLKSVWSLSSKFIWILPCHLYIVILVFFKINTLNCLVFFLYLVKLTFQESASDLFSAFMYPLAYCWVPTGSPLSSLRTVSSLFYLILII